jgi:hypothetical protein
MTGVHPTEQPTDVDIDIGRQGGEIVRGSYLELSIASTTISCVSEFSYLQYEGMTPIAPSTGRGGFVLRMNESEFSAWCRRLNLSVQAKTAVERIRTSPPSRGVKSGAGNVSGAYPSRKMGVAIQFESHKNELPTIYRRDKEGRVR